MNAKNSMPQGRIWSLKLHVAPNNGETKGIIHSRIIPAY
jgi:hypothetical protein